MFLYVVIEAIVALVVGILLAACTKKKDGVVYGKLDKAGQITNIILLIAYVLLLPFYGVLGMLSEAHYGGFLGILGWIVALIIGSAALFCGIGLGLSVAFRKQGKSKISFAVQFAGIGGIALSLILFFLFYGNLLSSIN